MRSDFEKFSLTPTYQNYFNTSRTFDHDDSYDHFNIKINSEKRKEDKILFIPDSPDLKLLLGKNVTKNNESSLYRIQVTEMTKYKAVNLQSKQSIQDKHKIQIHKIPDIPINLEEKEHLINLRTEDIFSTTSTFNTVDENLQENFLNSTKEFAVHKLIFEKDLENLSKLLKSFDSKKDLQALLVNSVDLRGNTPLTLCVLLRSIDKCSDYLDIIKELLKFDVNPRLKNFRKCNALEIATSFEDTEAVRIIFEYLLKRRKLKIERNELKAGNFLSKIPDIYLEMTWEVNIPLLKFMCPNDTCKLWKIGKNIRMDFSFQQFKHLSSIRCPSSYIFRGEDDINSGQPLVFQVNHKNNTYFNPFEPLESDEEDLIVKDILNCHRIDGEFKLKKCTVLESKSYFGKKPVYDKINKINAQKYEVRIAASVNLKNKEKIEYENICMDNYFNNNVELRYKTHIVMDNDKLKNHLANELKVKNDKFREQLMKLDNKEKSLKAYVWIAEEFPVKSSYLVAMFNSISGANEFTQKIKEFLNDPEIKKIIDKNGFPIKIVIPINFFIDVTVTFTKFYEIVKDEKLQSLFDIPTNYKKIPRKTVQDLKSNPKKRMGYANIQG